MKRQRPPLKPRKPRAHRHKARTTSAIVNVTARATVKATTKAEAAIHVVAKSAANVAARSKTAVREAPTTATTANPTPRTIRAAKADQNVVIMQTAAVADVTGRAATIVVRIATTLVVTVVVKVQMLANRAIRATKAARIARPQSKLWTTDQRAMMHAPLAHQEAPQTGGATPIATPATMRQANP